MRRVIRKDQQWKWTSGQDLAFKKLKKLILKAPVLRYFDTTRPITIQCDASRQGLGAVLIQEGHPVAFASRVLTTTEQYYAQIEKETLAIVFACQKFDQYICGQANVIVESDHRPLQNIFKKTILEAPKRLQRMRLSLQRYDIQVTYKKGEGIVFADLLSRAFIKDPPEKLLEDEEVYQINTNRNIDRLLKEIERINSIATIKIKDSRLQRIRQRTRILQRVLEFVLKGWPEYKRELPEAIRPYWNYREQLTAQDGYLLKGDRIVIPSSMRTELLQRIHYGHQGIEACLRRHRDIIFWPGISNDIRNTCMDCSTCKEKKASVPNHSGLLFRLL